MARAMARLQAWTLETGALDIKPGATLTLFEEGTAATTRTPLSVPIYAAKTGGSPISTVLTADATGQKTIFTATPCRFDVEVSGTGITAYAYANESFDVDPADLIYHVRLYGIVGDGVTDNAELFQDLVDTVYAAGGGRIRFERGVYRISTTILLYSDIDIEGAGIGETTLLWDDPEDADVGSLGINSFSVATSWSDFSNAFDVGYAGSNPAVSLDPNVAIDPGDYAVKLNTAGDSALFAAGDTVQVFSGKTGAASPDVTSIGVLTTRVTQIQSFGGATYLWLEDAIPWSFPLLSLPRLRYRLAAGDPVTYKLADRVGIRDLTISVGDGAGTETRARNRAYAIAVNGTRDLVVERVHIRYHRYRGIQTVSTANTKITASRFDTILSSRTSADGGGDGTGLEDYYSRGLLFEGNTIESTAWGATSNASYATKYRGNHYLGRALPYDDTDPSTNPKGLRTGGGTPDAGDTGRRLVGRGFKLQQACIHGEIDDNIVAGPGLTGIMVINASYCFVRRNQVLHSGCSNTETGISVAEETVTGRTHHVTVEGNLVRGAGAFGIAVGLIDDVNTYIAIRGNHVEESGSHGMFASNMVGGHIEGNTFANNVGDGLNLFTGCTQNVVAHNVFNQSGGNALVTTSGAGGNSIRNNEALAGAVTLHALDKVKPFDTLSVDATAITAGTMTNVVRPASTAHQVTFYSHGGPVTLMWCGYVQQGAGAGSMGFSLDGVAATVSLLLPASSGNTYTMSSVIQPAAGSHTVTVQGASSGGVSLTVRGTQALTVLQAFEGHY